MIEFGKTLRRAREAKGYTASQVAEMTHIKPSVLDGLENEDFSMIAAPIYGRGFVKLYCEAVGLDPKPLVDEFMAIMNGEHEIAIKERPAATEEPTAPVPPPQPAAPEDPPPPQPEQDLFRQDPVPPPQPAAPAEPPPPQPVAEPESTGSFARFAAPIRETAAPDYPVCLNPRILVLVGGALLILVALFFGIRALYRATTSAANADESTETEAPTVTEAPAAAPAAAGAPTAKTAPRTPQQIPSLYID